MHGTHTCTRAARTCAAAGRHSTQRWRWWWWWWWQESARDNYLPGRDLSLLRYTLYIADGINATLCTGILFASNACITVALLIQIKYTRTCGSAKSPTWSNYLFLTCLFLFLSLSLSFDNFLSINHFLHGYRFDRNLYTHTHTQLVHSRKINKSRYNSRICIA